jgi:tRNA threonylcarbamoyl adenosine modification protein (Sua5/YciO/YrdC/YwlC family)
MATVVDCADPVTLLPGMREARAAISRGDLVVMPTDTVYGIAADAFQPDAVQALLDAKGRGRGAPPPVLVPNRSTLDALAETVPDAVAKLADAFWPGGLTIVLPARTTLVWDLGETHGTVAVRMPDERIALELLAETGPLAVSSANRTGEPAATTAGEALEQLGDAVQVYLDAGATPGALPSTIVDATALAAGTGPLRILREGVILREALETVVPGAFDDMPEPEPEFEIGTDAGPDAETDGERDAVPATAPDTSGRSREDPASP